MSQRAFLAEKQEDKSVELVVRDIDIPVAGEGEVLINVEWSDINFKDCLASRADGRVARISPLVPGIDIAGTIRESNGSQFATNTPVIAYGYELGTGRDGGYREVANVPAEWVIPLPANLSTRNAMIAGTAGLTAALSVLAILDRGIKPSDGPVLVTGATGGVGSCAVAMLANNGFEVHASTGRTERSDWLKSLGAHTVVDRLPQEHKPLDSEIWAAVVDSVGGTTLSGALAQTKYHGVVTACGLTGGANFTSAVFPFILRGVSLVGIDSVVIPMTQRIRAWQWIGDNVKENQFALLAGREVGLGELASALDEVFSGKALGRTIVNPRI
jgi:acrylyl-CoA reductase (NADPH)